MKNTSAFLSALALTIAFFGCSGSPKGTAIQLPGQAPDITVVETNSSYVKLSWTAVDGAKFYNLYRSESETGMYTKVNEEDELRYTEHNDFTLSSYTTYWYKLSAANYGGEGPKSLHAASASLRTPIVPFGGWASNVTSTSITVNWPAVSGASGYKVYRFIFNGESYTPDGTFSCTGTSYTDSTVTIGTVYLYNVSAVSEDFGESNQNIVATQEAKDGEAPTGIPGFDTTKITTTSTSITIDWGNGSFDACGFNIYRSAAAEGTFTKVNTCPVYTTSYTNTGLIPNTTYYYKISAENVFGEGPHSDEKDYTTLSE